MDSVKVGQFIQSLRKEKNLTQKELADKIGISNKAISKWETGRSMPDTSILDILCKELNISVSELLAGEKLSPEHYAEMAEVTIKELLEENKKSKGGTFQIIVGVIIALLSLLLLIGGITGFSDFGSSITPMLDPSTFIVIVLICTAAIFISRARGLKQILNVVRHSVIAAGLLEFLVGLIYLWQAYVVTDTSATTSLSLYLQQIHLSYSVAAVSLLYATLIYLIVTLWLLNIENRESR